MFRGDYPYYSDVASITEAANVIITGEVMSAHEVKSLMVDRTSNKTDKETTPYTLSTVKVTQVIKGNLQVGDIITIKQLGDYRSKPEETLYEMDGYFKKGTAELMFLCEYENSPYSAVNPAQGIVQIINENELYSSNKYSLFGYTDNATKEKSPDTFENAVSQINDSIK